jgi:hypothetical protein
MAENRKIIIEVVARTSGAEKNELLVLRRV